MQFNFFLKIIYRNLIKIISVIISIVIMIIIYLNIDFSGFIEIFRNSDIKWLIISLLMVIPTTFFTTFRFKQLIPGEIKFKFSDLFGLILSASTMNMLLPSKMGDIAKAFFMKKRGNLDGTLALSIVVFEKTCDFIALLIFCLLGLIIYSGRNKLFWIIGAIIMFGLIVGVLLLASRKVAKLFFSSLHKLVPVRFKENVIKMCFSWNKMQNYFLEDKNRLLKISANSILIWFLHLLQIWFFILALKLWVPFIYNLALASLSILVGLLPLTLAGIGTRDAAIILFYNPFFNSAAGAALGLLYTLRYIIPAIAGIPFFGKYLSDIKQAKQKKNSIFT